MEVSLVEQRVQLWARPAEDPQVLGADVLPGLMDGERGAVVPALPNRAGRASQLANMGRGRAASQQHICTFVAYLHSVVE